MQKNQTIEEKKCFANINLYWWIMSTISISILLQKNTLWFYLLWTWLKQEIFLTLVGRWIEQSSQQISNFELVRDLLFFKSSNVNAFKLKFFRGFRGLIHWASRIWGLLKFKEAFQLNSNRTSRNFFECSSYVLEVEFLQSFNVLEKLCQMRGGMPSIYSGFKG